MASATGTDHGIAGEWGDDDVSRPSVDIVWRVHLLDEASTAPGSSDTKRQ
jgi:hypothetical protein